MMRVVLNVLGKLILVILLFFQTVIFREPTEAQPPTLEQLPDDLVFTGWESFDRSAPATLALVDAKTLKVTPLYVDEKAVNLRAVSWSPQGDLLAVLRIYPKPDGEYGYPTAICIVAIAAGLRTCFDDTPPLFFAEAPFLIDFNYSVTWSADGRKVYFVTEDRIRGVRRLIEANPLTGETIRAVYETKATNGDGIPTIITWTPGLDYVASGVGFPERSGVLVNLKTGKHYDLSEIVVSWLGGDVRNQPERAGFVCNSFSPQGAYLVAIDQYDDRLLLFNKELEITHVIDNLSTDGQAIVYCPTWSEDEDIIYFLVKVPEEMLSYVITYSLKEDRTIAQIQAPIYPPLVFSPDRTYIAFTEPDASLGTYRVKVMHPDGEIQGINSPFLRSEYPLWRGN